MRCGSSRGKSGRWHLFICMKRRTAEMWERMRLRRNTGIYWGLRHLSVPWIFPGKLWSIRRRYGLTWNCSRDRRRRISASCIIRRKGRISVKCRGFGSMYREIRWTASIGNCPVSLMNWSCGNSDSRPIIIHWSCMRWWSGIRRKRFRILVITQCLRWRSLWVWACWNWILSIMWGGSWTRISRSFRSIRWIPMNRCRWIFCVSRS